MTIKVIPEECIAPKRPDDLDINNPWPPEYPQYPLPHRVWNSNASDSAFNIELAESTFGKGCVERVLDRQALFKGDVWLLCALKLTEESSRTVDKDGEYKYRFSWITNRVHISKLCVQPHPIHLEGISIRGWDLRRVDLSNAILRKSTITRSNLSHAILWSCDISKSSVSESLFIESSCFNVNFCHTNLSTSSFKRANLKHSRMNYTRLCGSDLDRAVLTNVSGLLFDYNSIDKILIEGNSKDPWSILRRTYTGPKYILNIILLIAFLLPFIGKAAYLTALSATQQSLIEISSSIEESTKEIEAISSVLQQSISHIQTSQEQTLAVAVLLGWTDGIFTTLLIAVVILYNLFRAYLTFKVSSLREAEDRSKVSPTINQYYGDFHPLSNVKWRLNSLFLYYFRLLLGTLFAIFSLKNVRIRRDPLEQIGLFRLHLAARVLFWIAIGSIIYNTLRWIATTTVWV